MPTRSSLYIVTRHPVTCVVIFLGSCSMYAHEERIIGSRGDKTSMDPVSAFIHRKCITGYTTFGGQVICAVGTLSHSYIPPAQSFGITIHHYISFLKKTKEPDHKDEYRRGT